MSRLTSWYVDAARRGLHEAGGDLLVVGGVVRRQDCVVGALLRVARVEVVDLVPGQVRLAQLQSGENSENESQKKWRENSKFHTCSVALIAAAEGSPL